VTHGEPRVRALAPAPGVSEEALLRAAASAEFRSEHPIGRTIVAFARARGISLAEPDEFDYHPGRGIRVSAAGETILVGNATFLRESALALPDLGAAESATSVLVSSGSRYLGSISVADTVRAEAASSIAAIRRLGIRTVLLTGDVRSVAESVARELSVDEVHAELLPEQKSAYVAQLVRSGNVVAMVGDGVNDAPALVAATVGIAMGSGTDVARESADVVLLGNDLSRLVGTLEIARRTRAIVMQNFVGTIGVDAAGILLAAFGVLSPLLAAFVHVTSELAFILNSTRMLARPDGARAHLRTRAHP
jgi:Cd2+/Zn2+-exporting ATPase/Cu+-exporting ATPase